MKITLEFTDAERFMKELPQFAKAIGFASQFVQFSRTGKKDGDIDIQADVPDVVIGPDGEHLVKAGDADRVIKAAKKVGTYAENAPEKAPEKPQDAPKETADKVSTETAKAPENAKSEASADKEKMPKPVEADAVDIATCRKVLHAKIKAGFRDQMKELLAKLGAENVSTLAPEKYSEFVSEANKIGGGDNA
jgi:hypothetical protein